jgi:hypothetical protein
MQMKEEYIVPSMMVVDVACETGYKASTGKVTYVGGADDGWYAI